MARTYQPGLYLALSFAHKYATRYQAQLQANLSGPAYTCLIAVIAALAECLPLIAPGPPTP